MATLKDLKPSISELEPDAVMSLILAVRNRRRAPASRLDKQPRRKSQKAPKDMAGLVGSMSEAQLLALLSALEEQEE